MQNEIVDTHLRLPGPLYDQLRVAAARHRRSLNAQIIVALEDWLEAARSVDSALPQPPPRIQPRAYP